MIAIFLAMLLSAPNPRNMPEDWAKFANGEALIRKGAAAFKTPKGVFLMLKNKDGSLETLEQTFKSLGEAALFADVNHPTKD
jgi:hypothetical protein